MKYALWLDLQDVALWHLPTELFGSVSVFICALDRLATKKRVSLNVVCEDSKRQLPHITPLRDVHALNLKYFHGLALCLLLQTFDFVLPVSLFCSWPLC